MDREERITRYEEMLDRAESAARLMEEAEKAYNGVQDDLRITALRCGGRILKRTKPGCCRPR